MASDSPAAVAALCNAPDAETARNIARVLISDRLAACVNILPACTSIYRWRGTIEEETEIPMLIKTTAARVPALKKAVRRLHPAETPELIVFPITAGLDDYLQWVEEECGE